jgi:RNA polymerase sigma factor (TIGR02999 family)
MSDVTRILGQIESGDPTAAQELLPLVYEELRKLAAAKMAQEKPDQTLQATALVHEAYIRLVDGDRAKSWDSRGHFFAAAAEAMRRILVDNARQKRSLKRGGLLARVDLDEGLTIDATPPDELLALDDALAKLAKEDPVKANLVKLCYYAGLISDEAVSVMSNSPSTADPSSASSNRDRITTPTG